MQKRYWRMFIPAVACACLVLTVAAGCAPTVKEQPVTSAIAPPPLFPPQDAMRKGNYAELLAESESAMKTCTEPEQCAVALFNIGFLHCYSRSPYYNPARGLKYLEDLINGAPESPWAYQARMWADLIRKARGEARKRRVRDDAKSKEPAANHAGRQGDRGPEPSAEQTADGGDKAGLKAEDPTWANDRNRLEGEIRSRDEAIRQLKRQLERSRQIDIEIERKERGLLY